MGYALLITVSGFWNRASLVVLTTVLSILGYRFLLASAYQRGFDLGVQNRPSIVIPVLALLEVMIAHQVRRCRIEPDKKPGSAQSV